MYSQVLFNYGEVEKTFYVGQSDFTALLYVISANYRVEEDYLERRWRVRLFGVILERRTRTLCSSDKYLRPRNSSGVLDVKAVRQFDKFAAFRNRRRKCAWA